MIRRLVGCIVGLIAANLAIFGWEQLLYLLPFGAALRSGVGAVATLPFAAKAWIVIGWTLGTFLGALLAFRIARWDYAGFVVAALVAAAGIATVVTIPHPLWMRLAAVAMPFVAAVFAFGTYRRLRATDLHLRH